jgi:pyridoxine/pyridoxamine 5'-phosphate oxidase
MANNPYQPEKLYNNADVQKAQILSENKQKSGVYLWRNLKNKQNLYR